MKRILCLLLVFLMAFGVMLTSCSNKGGPTEGTETEAITTSPPQAGITYDYVLMQNGSTNFQLVRSDANENVNPEIQWVRYFYTQIKEKTGVQMSIKTDWDPEDIAEYEIVIGKTTREKDVAAIDRSQLGEKDFLITLQGNRLFIIGGSVEGTGLGVKYFLTYYVNEAGCVSVPEDLHLLVTYTYPVESVLLDGTPLEEYRIVYENGNAMIKYAADELRDYLYAATGVLLTVSPDGVNPSEKEILVGKTNREAETALIDRDGLGEEGFIIALKNGKLVISGGEEDVRGTLYGVYEFLEAYIGWRFFTTDTEVVYPSESISLEDGLTDRQVPQFEFRDSFMKCYFNADIAAKRRCNFVENHGFTASHGGGFAYAGFVHTLGALSETGNGNAGTPCLSDEAIYQTVLKNVKAKLDDNPNAKVISVSQNDVVDGYCKCEACLAKDAAAGSHMASLLLFVNRIARDIAEEYPDVMVDTLAYLYTLEVPNGIVPEDNVIIRFCPMDACRNHALTDPDCATNVKYVRYLQKWAAVCDRIYVWDYTGNHMYPTSPFPEFDVIRENVLFFAESGVTGYFMQGNMYSYGFEFAELKAYLIAKLLWDPYMSEAEYQTHMTEFLKAYYGAGWENIQNWIDFTDDLTSKYSSTHYTIYAATSDYLKKNQFTEDGVIEQIDAWWDAAEAVADNSTTLAHIQKTRASYEVIKLTYRYPDEYLFGSDEQKKAYMLEANMLLELCQKFNLLMGSGYDVTTPPIQWK